MTTNYVEISYLQVGVAAALILVNAAISLALQLGMEKTLLTAALRTVGQLLLVGFILDWVFAIDRWFLVVATAAVMTCIAGVSATSRVKQVYRGLSLDAILAIFVSSWCVTGLALAIVVPERGDLLDPQFAIPLIGMVLGNALNGITLGLHAFTSAVSSRRFEAETLLALGATRWEAAREFVREAVHSGLTPIINSMMVVGLVSLPGMMTGQILAGVEPMEAVKYQIVIMFLIASATAVGATLAVLAAYARLFDRNHCLLPWRLRERKPGP